MVKLIAVIFFHIIFMFFSLNAFSDHDVRVKGYHRDDGTYVRPHIRKSPDEYKYNNYGPSQNSDQLMKPKSRNYDHDESPNYLDDDDDNDGAKDDEDYPFQYQYNR